MNRSFRFLCATGMAALLVACGGGSDSTSTSTSVAEQPGWGSPAMFVPAGTSQITIDLASCEEGGGAIRTLEAPQRAASIPITSPSLVLTSEGNAIFSGVRNGSSTVSEIARVTFSQADRREIQLSSNADQNGFYVEQGNAGIYTDYSGSNRYLRVSDANGVDFYCGSRGQLTAAYAPSETRLTDKLSRGASTWLSSTIGGSPTAIVNDTVVWYNQAPNTTLPSNQTNARYASLNVNTGALKVGPGSSAANITQSIALTAALASGGYYVESDYTDTDFSSGRAKEAQLELDSLSQGRLRFRVVRGDDVLVVYPKMGDSIVLVPILPVAQ